MNKFFLLVTVTCFSMLQTCGQVKNVIVKSNGYFFIPTPGTIAVDDNGKPLDAKRDTVFLVFAEVKATGIQWDGAWMDNRSFSIMPSQIKQSNIKIGNQKDGSGKVELTTSKGNSLWQLGLTDDQTNRKAPQALASHELLIKGRTAGRVFYIKLKSLTELASPEYQ